MDRITVHVIFAHAADAFWQQSLCLEKGCSIRQALQLSELYSTFDRSFIDTLGVSIFGKKADLDAILQEGDRIELCRHLSFDPKESRKRRAQHRKAGILKKKHLKPDRAKKIEVDVHTH